MSSDGGTSDAIEAEVTPIASSYVMVDGVADAKQASDAHPLVPNRPAWVPDEASPWCSSCSKMFSLTIRRHHCRSCGRVLCAACTAKGLWRALPHLGYEEDKAQRVCVNCHAAYILQVRHLTTDNNGATKLVNSLVSFVQRFSVSHLAQVRDLKAQWDSAQREVMRVEQEHTAAAAVEVQAHLHGGNNSAVGEEKRGSGGGRDGSGGSDRSQLEQKLNHLLVSSTSVHDQLTDCRLKHGVVGVVFAQTMGAPGNRVFKEEELSHCPHTRLFLICPSGVIALTSVLNLHRPLSPQLLRARFEWVRSVDQVQDVHIITGTLEALVSDGDDTQPEPDQNETSPSTTEAQDQVQLPVDGLLIEWETRVELTDLSPGIPAFERSELFFLPTAHAYRTTAADADTSKPAVVPQGIAAPQVPASEVLLEELEYVDDCREVRDVFLCFQALSAQQRRVFLKQCHGHFDHMRTPVQWESPTHRRLLLEMYALCATAAKQALASGATAVMPVVKESTAATALDQSNGKPGRSRSRSAVLSDLDPQDAPQDKDARWKLLGFQGVDPTTDFRGMGQLALHCITFLARHESELLGRMLVEQPEESLQQYPVCVAVINCVSLVANTLFSRASASTPSSRSSRFSLSSGRSSGASVTSPFSGTAAGGVVNGAGAGGRFTAQVVDRSRLFHVMVRQEEAVQHPFEELVALCMRSIHRLWQQESATYFEFGRIIASVKERLLTGLQSNPISFQVLCAWMKDDTWTAIKNQGPTIPGM